MKVEQEWNGQDIMIVVNDRVATHYPLDMIIVRFERGHICETEIPNNILYLIPETARQLAAKLQRAAARAEREAAKYLERQRKSKP